MSFARSGVDSADGIVFFGLNGPITGDGQINSWSIYAGQVGRTGQAFDLPGHGNHLAVFG